MDSQFSVCVYVCMYVCEGTWGQFGCAGGPGTRGGRLDHEWRGRFRPGFLGYGSSGERGAREQLGAPWSVEGAAYGSQTWPFPC